MPTNTSSLSSPVQTGSQILSEEQVALMERQGFLALDRITTEEDVAEIRQVLEELFGRKAGHEQGAYFNFAGDEKDKNAPVLPQIMAPRNFAGRLMKSQFRRNAEILATQILGPEARFHVDHTLMKPPLNGVPTPWHQDEAFKDPLYESKEVSIWMPLQPVDEINGCMKFIPGTHLQEVLPHRTPGNDPGVHALECYEGFDLAQAVSCPIGAGGCTIHYGRTLHGAGPNLSNNPRYAYVLIFQLPHERVKTPRSFPWLEGRATERMARQQRWLKSSGRFVRKWRTVRDMEFRDVKRLFKKAIKKIKSRISPSK